MKNIILIFAVFAALAGTFNLVRNLETERNNKVSLIESAGVEKTKDIALMDTHNPKPLTATTSPVLIAKKEASVSKAESSIQTKKQLAVNLNNSTYTTPISSTQILGTGTAKSVPVLLYHGEGTNTGNTPINVFTDQMQTLKQAGWNTITMEQFYSFMKGKSQLPDKSFLLTFDDGRRDTYYPVDPVLKNLGFNAVMFVITGFSLPDQGKNPSFYLSQSELQTMKQSGRWELESHGKEDHRKYPILASLTAATTTSGDFLSNKFWLSGQNRYETDQEFTARITNDLTLSKQTLEQKFSIPILGYAFPFNDFGQDTINFPESKQIVSQVTSSIYPLTFYQTWPGNGDTFNYPNPSQTTIKRIEPNINWTGQQLLSKLESDQYKSLPFKESSNFGQEWISNWGTVSSGNYLQLQALANTTGASAFLNGSELWKDYNLTATFSTDQINWENGSEIALVARHSSANNYLTCAFTNKKAYLEKHENGVQSIVTTVPYTASSSSLSSNLTISMSVKGDNVKCYSDNTEIISSDIISQIPQNGEIGVQAWDQTLGVASAKVNSVDVEPL